MKIDLPSTSPVRLNKTLIMALSSSLALALFVILMLNFLPFNKGVFKTVPQPIKAATTFPNVPALNAYTIEGGLETIFATSNSVYYGGNVSSVVGPSGSYPTHYLAKMSADGIYDLSFNPNFNGQVRVFTLSRDGATLYVGGAFTRVDGETRNLVAVFNTKTGQLTSFNPNILGQKVHALVLSPDGSTLYIGGEFTKVGGKSKACLAAVDTKTSKLTSFQIQGCSILALALSRDGSILYSAGYGGAISFINTSGKGRVTNFVGISVNPFSAATVFSLLLSPDERVLYVGGVFQAIGGKITFKGDTPRKNLAALYTSNGQVTPFNPDPNGEIYDLVITNDGLSLFAEGPFTKMGGQSRNSLAEVDPTTGELRPWSPTLGIGPIALSPDNTELYWGKDYTFYESSAPTPTPSPVAGESWTIAYDSADTHINGLAFDNSQNVLYAGSSRYDGTWTPFIYRCPIATGCDSAADWSTVFTLNDSSNGIIDMVFDSANKVLYAAEDATGMIYRCDPSLTLCDEQADWIAAFDSPSYIVSLEYSSADSAIYAGTSYGGVIFRCDTSSGCDQDGDWVVSYDTPDHSIETFTIDSVNGVIYAGSNTCLGCFTGKMYRCQVSTGCNEASDWTSYYMVPGGGVSATFFEPVNKVLYASNGYTNGNGASGVIYRCEVTSGCDESTDWVQSYDPPTTYGIESFAFDSTSNRVYAGAAGGLVIYVCSVSTLCDEESDWSISFSSKESSAHDLVYDTAANKMYAGSGPNGIIYQRN